MDSIIHQIAKEYKAALQNIYGDDLAELVLFGSYARGEQHDESDLDLAVVFRTEQKRSFEDKFQLAKEASRLSLKYGLMLSPLATNLYKKQTSMQGIYQEIRKYGISI